MPYHSHILNSTHSHIIERKDPITGDSVQENDSVVFCAVCKSCFLEGSWKYMNEEHCNQNETLRAVPVLPKKLIFKKETTQLVTELLSSYINLEIVLPSAILSLIVSFFAIVILRVAFIVEIPFRFSWIFAGVGAVVSAVLCNKPKYRNITGNHKDDIRIFRNYIELGRQRISLEKIRQIKYQREVRVERVAIGGRNVEEYYTSLIPCILIYFDNGRFIKKDLPTGDYKKVAKFLKGLERISYFREVFFYSENKKEYELMQRIQSRSNGNIVIGEPARLFHNL